MVSRVARSVIPHPSLPRPTIRRGAGLMVVALVTVIAAGSLVVSGHALGGQTQALDELQIDGPLPATAPGGVIQHSLVLTNTGSSARTIALDIDDYDWPVHLPEPILIEPGEGAHLTIEVAVPSQTADGEVVEARLLVSADGTTVAERTLASWTGGSVVGGRWAGCRMDLNGDGVIDENDTAMVVAAFGARRGASHWDAALDLNGDGRVGAGDVQRVASSHGGICDAPWRADSAVLRDAMTADAMMPHLESFQRIAEENGGHRAVGSPGHAASIDYVATKLEDAGWDVMRQPKNFPRIATAGAVLAVAGEDLERGTDFDAFDGAPAGDVTGTLIAINVNVPPAGDESSGCSAEEFDALPAGAVVLLQRGSCTFRQKIDNAVAAGATAVIIFNQGTEERIDLYQGGIGSNVGIPAMRASYTVGERLVERLRAGEELLARVAVLVDVTDRWGENIVAEWPHGDADRVVMAGAHLDSVPAGPGLNDNGTGSAALLAIAEAVNDIELRPRHRLRLAWWTAEEIGLLGSAHYVAELPRAERDRLLAYLNFDMIGSPNFIRAVYDGDGSDSQRAEPFGSGHVEWLLRDYFDRAGLPHEPIGDVIYRRSDHASFSEAGIPVGGLFSGFTTAKTEEQAELYGGQAGAAADGCYHRGCDKLENVNIEGLLLMADAVAHAIQHLGDDLIYPLASYRAFPAQRPGAASAAPLAEEIALRRALDALSVEGGCAGLHVEQSGFTFAPYLEPVHVAIDIE